MYIRPASSKNWQPGGLMRRLVGRYFSLHGQSKVVTFRFLCEGVGKFVSPPSEKDFDEVNR